MQPARLTSIVGSKFPNAWGLHDMHGNVMEWCFENVNSRFLSGRVLRGGSWIFMYLGCRSASRGAQEPSFHFRSVGFRLALSPSIDSEVKGAEAAGLGTEGAVADQPSAGWYSGK